VRLIQISIATRLYAIFALLAAITVGLAVMMAVNAHRHAALTAEFEKAFRGGQEVERITGVIYAILMETRGIYMAEDDGEARQYAAGLAKFNDRLAESIKEWQRNLRQDDADKFREFSGRVRIFQEYRGKLAALVTEGGLPVARQWRGFDDHTVAHTVLTSELRTLAEVYAQRAERLYAGIEQGAQAAAWTMTALGALALLLAAAGAFIIWQSVARPLGRIARITEQVAAGETQETVPYTEGRDEVGALARSISVFQKAMRRNEELSRAVVEDAQGRTRRQEAMSNEIGRFGSEVEATLGELGRISDQMLAASGALAQAADQASDRTAGAVSASSDASVNVRDIASAAEELAASVLEIDRQVAQSNEIATKAVTEAEWTNDTVKELNEAAGRIGDVIKLITDIAEQTNLLALNATIEAARAGTAGRGFAVVANEVKALAGQTAKATEDISAQIAGMQKATTRSIAAIAAIASTIRDIGEITSAIAAAVTEQGAATQEIARSVETASRRTTETAGEVGRVGEATAATRQNAGAVKAVADELGHVAGRIRGQVDAFFQKLRAS
jgi:methyl-accepting chemotaxis protein